ncbi:MULTISPECIES: DUF6779 domain-containing protein [unclassified Corynebacterium]|uniref:DUF6779 domain-containing protein n=1 Tax=unclassified Corynebacterium TaxID=2624378 RepID=UPI0021687106|nr:MULTISPECIES: DUF6779 domain-containing protein [unclassified Corynebacterium]MCS4490246.1 hypothetical protein [Corynebacterium sp. ES2775-CONJ]MCS4491943.1 hypothetical protein [Corynebacterium sp. ES2715-CONJ3]
MKAEDKDTLRPVDKNRDLSPVLLVILVSLAVIASVIMLVTSSISSLKVAMVLALWAALIGAFLVFRYQRDMGSQTRLYRAQLLANEKRYLAEKRRSEAEFERRINERVDIQAESALGEINSQLQAVMSQLEQLSGAIYSTNTNVLQAEAVRVKEIEEVAEKLESKHEDPHYEPSYRPSFDPTSFSRTPWDHTEEFEAVQPFDEQPHKEPETVQSPEPVRDQENHEESAASAPAEPITRSFRSTPPIKESSSEADEVAITFSHETLTQPTNKHGASAPESRPTDYPWLIREDTEAPIDYARHMRAQADHQASTSGRTGGRRRKPESTPNTERSPEIAPHHSGGRRRREAIDGGISVEELLKKARERE